MVYFWTYAHHLYCPYDPTYKHMVLTAAVVIRQLRKMPIRSTKSAHDLRKMPIRPTKSAHLTYKIGWRRPTASYTIIISNRAICMIKAAEYRSDGHGRYAHPTYSCRRSDVAVCRKGSIADGQ